MGILDEGPTHKQSSKQGGEKKKTTESFKNYMIGMTSMRKFKLLNCQLSHDPNMYI